MTWPRDTWVRRMKATTLHAHAKLVGRSFADYAIPDKQTNNPGDLVWVAREVLCSETSLSEASVKRAVRTLREEGWLEEIHKPRQHYSALYRLVIPEGSP